ncbi:unnamed protein product [Blepharisma stoltei]|uniref:Uncharacterized protein n=1 Tax=Blepharisma stoltei TaxID=1481888 RepID=A0AAU9IDD3_9CILI|nr:unnamed protein product [Blepharisma stoltei]
MKSKKKKDKKLEQKNLLINRSLPNLNAIEMFISKDQLPNGAEIRLALGVRGHLNEFTTLRFDTDAAFNEL